MNEPEILEAYRGLSTPVSAPPDVLERVERRITRRRTARLGVAGVAALTVAGGIGAYALSGSDGTSTQVASDQGGELSTLTYTDTDGSTYTFETEDIGIACATQQRRGKQVDVLTLSNSAGDAVLHVELLLDKVRPGQVFDLPYESQSGSSDGRPMTFFFTNGTADDSNELSSAESGSSGTVTVNAASCGPNPVLDIGIDGTLGSEVEQPALAITGEYRS